MTKIASFITLPVIGLLIAGGIGLTPFLSFMRDLDKKTFDHDVDFYYAVRHRDETLFFNEITAQAFKHPRLKLYPRYSASGGSLTVDEIVRTAGGNVSGHHIYMCGPYPMLQAFEKKFLAAGVPTINIHYEEFNFR